MSFNLQKSLAILSAIPALGQVVNAAVQQVETAIPQTGFLSQKITAAGNFITQTVNVAMEGLDDLEKIAGVGMAFASEILTIYENAKTGVITSTTAPPVVAPAQ